jgi:hypothetical protein
MTCTRRSNYWILPAVVVAFVLVAQRPSAAQKGPLPPLVPPEWLFVSLSPGSTLTAEDVQVFDDKWMTQYQHDSFVNAVHNAFWVGYDPFGIPLTSAVWGIAERMSAMARMYELTRAPKYLDELRGLTNLVMAGRDDHIDLVPDPASTWDPAGWQFQPDPTSRADGLRGNRVMPAWGYRSVANGGFHSSDLGVAGLYAYPMAAFARIVAEDPALYATYGADAKAAATSILQMLQAFWPELQDPNLTPGGENFFANPVGVRLLTYETCSRAYSAALQLWYAGMSVANDPAWAYADGQALEAGFQKCSTDSQVIAAYPTAHPLAHNEYQAFVMALIELSRALDSDLYKVGLPQCAPVFTSRSPLVTRCRPLYPPLYPPPPSPPLQYVEDVARRIIPAIVAGAQRYYFNRYSGVLWYGPDGFWPGVFANMYQWHYLDDNPPSVPHDLDDTSHAAVEMQYIGLLWRNTDRLNALLGSSDQIALSATHMSNLANTFLAITVRRNSDSNGLVQTHLAENLYGRLGTDGTWKDGWAANPIDRRDNACDGWLNLAEFNSLVYNACETVTLHGYDQSIDNHNVSTKPQVPQPNLQIGNHAALLALKQFRGN